MISYKQIKIEDTTYTIQQFTAPKSLKLLTRMAKLVGPSVSSFMMNDGMKKKNVEALMTSSLGALFDRLDEDLVINTIAELLEGTLVGSVPVSNDWETRFMGKLPTLFKVLKESLKVQYGDFGNVLALLSARAQAMGTMSMESRHPNTSSGQSGE